MKKALSIVLTLALMLTVLPFSLMSVPVAAEVVASGTMGNYEWTLNDGVLTISPYYDSGADGDNGIIMPDDDFGDEWDDGTTTSSSWSQYADGITSVVIEDGVTKIDDAAFAGCINLATIIVPDSVTSIGGEAFTNTAWYNNQPEGLVYAGKVAYDYKGTCPSTLTIKESTLGIADSAFKNDSALTKVTIPVSMVNIGGWAFYNCTGLKSVSYGGSQATREDMTIGSGNTYLTDATWNYALCSHEYDNACDTNCNLCGEVRNVSHNYVDVVTQPTCTERGYTTHTCSGCGISYKDNYINALGHTYTNDDDGSCDRCGYVRFPSGTTGSCTWKLIDTILTISGNGAMEDYGGNGICLPDDEWDDDYGSCPAPTYAPWNSYTITEVIIENGVTYIGSEAFCNCAFTKINIPLTVTGIGFNAFSNYGSGIDVYYAGSECAVATTGMVNELLNATWHYAVASVHEYSGVCDADCNICGVVRDVPEHTFSSTCDVSCNVCGYTRTVSGHVYTDDCDSVCNSCGFTRNVTHVYDNSCDTNCNLCGAVRTVQHSYVDTITKPTCTVRGYTTHTCSGCGISYKDTYTNALGHSKYTVSLQNPTTYPFSLSNGIYTSSNKEHNSSSTFTLTALYDCNLTIQYRTSSETNYDKLTITHNTVVKDTLSGTSTTWKTLTLTLTKGDKVYIKYAKDVSVSSGDDAGYFKLDIATISVDDLVVDCGSSVLCDICGVIAKPTTSHTYDNACDATCNICGSVRTISGHSYSAVYDPDCNVCGYKRFTDGGVTGSCYWILDGTVITISGNGRMDDYCYYYVPGGDELPTESWGEEAPWYGYEITEVIIENGVTHIGEGSFFNVLSIEKVTIPASVIAIGVCAFEFNDSANVDVYYAGSECISKTIDGVYWLSGAVWYYGAQSVHEYDNVCDTTCNICGSVRTISGHSYSAVYDPDCNICGYKRFTDGGVTGSCYWILDGTVITISGNGRMDDYYYYYAPGGDELPTESWEEEAPWYGYEITEVIIENGVTHIGEGSFYDVSSVKKVTIPTSVITIGVCAFEFNNDVSVDVYYAGSKCVSKTIDGVYWLSGAVWHYGAQSVHEYDDICDGDCNICGLTRYDAFGITGDCKWYVLNNVLTINGNGAMGDYTEEDMAPWGTDITEVVFVGNITKIGARAFSKCASLTSVVIPDSVTAIGEAAFLRCSNLNTVVLPEGVKTIEYATFSSCTSLESIVIPNGLYIIEIHAFSGCSSLKEITLPKTIDAISDRAFYYCNAIINVYYGGNTADRSAIRCGVLNETILGAKWHYKSCEVHTFDNACDSFCDLCEITRDVPDHIYDNTCDTACNECGFVREVFDHVYDNACDAFCNVCDFEREVPDHAYDDICDGDCNICGLTRYDAFGITGDCKWYVLNNVLTINGNGAMGDYTEEDMAPWGTDITEVVFVGNITKIGARAFSKCASLTNVVIPNSVTAIGEAAFLRCSNLNTVVLPEGIKTIEYATFSSCISLENIIIPEGVTVIGTHAFSGCSGLAQITLPNSVVTIKDRAFYYCDALKDVYYNGNTADRAKIGIDTTRNETFISAKWHYKPCDVHAFDNACDSFCDLCEITRDVPDHVYDNTCDTTCNECGFERTITHTYDNACDTTCNICGFIRTVGDHNYVSTIIDPTCTEIGYTIYTCSICGVSYVIDEVPAMGHSYDEVVIKPTCTLGGYTNNICYACGDSYITNEVAATGHIYSDWIVEKAATTDATGSQYKQCACGEKITMVIPRKIKFAGASLTLESNIAINYKVKPEYFDTDKYDEIYLVVSFNGTEYTLRNPEFIDDRWVFSFKEVSGHMMTDLATATIYGVYQGETFKGNSAIYDVITYAKTMLPKPNTEAKVKKLIVDLVNYGAAAQIYTNHNTENLANAWLTDEQLALGTQELRETTTHQNLKYEVIDNPTVSWKGAGLKLEAAITVRYTIQADDLTDLKAVLQINGETFEVPSSEFVLVEGYTNRYYIYFDEPTASQMSMPILATIVKGDTAVSNTVQYSIESYINTNKAATKPAGLADLVQAMLKYGDSANAYAYGG